MTDTLALFGGLIALYLGGECLLRGAMGLGARLRFTPVMTGLVLVAFGTSAPELAVGIDAALQGHGDIAVGNVIGSNIVNIALVLGIAAAVRTIPTPRESTGGDMLALALLTGMTLAFLLDGVVSALEGGALLATLCLAMTRSLANARAGDEAAIEAETGSPVRCGFELVGGVALLVVGAELTVAGGIGVALMIGVSEAVIALTVTAVGTGLPEIAATVVALTRGQAGVALGNVIGSNLINIGLVLGLSALVAPLEAPGVGPVPLLTLAGLTLVLTLVVLASLGVRRWLGVALLSGFGLYNVSLFV